ncbi:hypothetical protein YTPLAS18_15050 [Nitrospira sp.]|nr:hypothetical protein YTPLAS18_15050 [Nitrospira sp.]
MEAEDNVEIRGMFAPDADLEALTRDLCTIGVAKDEIHVMSPVPLVQRASIRIGGVPLYMVTIMAGLVGIGVGLFFAGGTAALYPLMTGGKPIVAPPIVGIISYETMMLLAIVITFVSMVVKLRLAGAKIHHRDNRIDDGQIAVSIRLAGPDASAGRAADVRTAYERAGAHDIQSSVLAPVRDVQGHVVQHAGVLVLCVLTVTATVACSQDMQEQASYHSQESPRLHSPEGSVPRTSRAKAVRHPVPIGRTARGERLFHINCRHCHGAHGGGDGPVAPYLKELPANLRNPDVTALSETDIFRVITEGKDMMPAFKGLLSVEDRWHVAGYAAFLSHLSTMQTGTAEPS